MNIILTFADTIDLSVGTGFFIPASREHGDRLPLIFLLVGEVVSYDTCQLSIVSQAAQKRSGSGVEISGASFFVEAKIACYHLFRFLQKCNSSFVRIKFMDLAVFSTSIDEWQFQGRAGVTAIENEEECTAWW